MDRQELDKDKLIAWIDALNGQVVELKKAEALQKKVESDLLSRLVYDSAPECLSEANVQGDLFDAMNVVKDVTGHTLEELKDMNAYGYLFTRMAAMISRLKMETAVRGQLNEMGEQLQSCQNMEEACAIGAEYIQRLFPASDGALYIIGPSKDYAQAVTLWGDAVSTEKVFALPNCWAVRRGRLHLVDDAHPGLLCGHIAGPKTDRYLCVPMIAHGEIMGIVHLHHTAPGRDQHNPVDRQYSQQQTQRVVEIAESIALALSGLKQRDYLHQQAMRDVLTGLFNRRYLEETLTRELHRADREKKPLGLILFDIDNFKMFNDQFGHDGGDALLRELGSFLIKRTRGGDIVSRYGGEEFVIVFPGASLENTKHLAEKLRQDVRDLLVYHKGKPLKNCTISLGVAVFPEHGSTGETILKNADKALYRAKNEGRDRVVVASAKE